MKDAVPSPAALAPVDKNFHFIIIQKLYLNMLQNIKKILINRTYCLRASSLTSSVFLSESQQNGALDNWDLYIKYRCSHT